MDIQGLIEKYEDCFGDIGKLPVTHHITVKPDIKPVVHPQGTFHLAWKQNWKKN